MRSFRIAVMSAWLCCAATALSAEEPAASGSAATAECIPAAALDAYVEKRRERRVSQWQAVPAPKGGIVFLGSSIIEEGPWAELFAPHRVVNRGIGADTTKGVLDRLDEVIALEPDKVFLYIGGNDFSRLDDTPENAIRRLTEILDRLRAALPDTELFVSTLLAREAKHAETIGAFNDGLKSSAFGPRVTTVDAYPLFARDDGSMDPRYSNDRIHLNGEAYLMWAELLRPHLGAE